VKKGQASGSVMGLITLAVAIMVGAFIVGNVYNSSIGSAGTTTFPTAIESAMNDSMDSTSTGLLLMSIAIIVGAAMFILALMNSR